MRYKGYTLENHYLPGSTFRIKDGRVINRKPTLKDIDYVRATPDDGGHALNCANMSEAKAWADKWPVKK